MSWEGLASEVSDMFAELSGFDVDLAYAQYAATQHAAMRERYHTAREQGLCTYCFRSRGVDGRTRCAACLDIDRERKRAEKAAAPETVAARNRAAYQKRRALGVCSSCLRAQARPGKVHCQACALANTRHSRARRARLIAEKTVRQTQLVLQ